jgi:AIPR protein
VSFVCVGAKEIQKLYRDAESSVEASFEFPDTIVLPDIQGVEEAHVGVVSAREYLRLITDPAGNIRRSLFYDNVRDFQDYNEVNRGIRETIQDPTKRPQFVVLNNGVTIVARELLKTRNTFTLRDYQIVNGCQTSHVLFDERDSVGDQLFLSLKVIVTRDEKVASSITAATNKQTEVSDEDLQALETLQKELEDYFAAHPLDKKLYYERRSKQYANAGSQVEKTRIIGRSQLVKAYAAMFLDEPWRAGRYYKQLQKLRSDEIFAPTDLPFAYYVSAAALYRLDYFFRNQYIDNRYKPARYQLLMAVRHSLAGAEQPPQTKRHLERYCDELAAKLWDLTEGPAAFQRLLPVIDDAVRATDPGGILDRDSVRTQTFTDHVKLGVKTLQRP